MEKIYICGNGAMASALAFGLRERFEVKILGREISKMQDLKNAGFDCEIYGNSFDISGKMVILAFKPYALAQMSEILKGKAEILISVMANISLNDLSVINAENSVVCMPNIAAKFSTSTTPFFTKSKNEKIFEILSAFGDAIKLENEADMGAAGVLSGCVPAFLALVAESLANGGVKCGLKKEISSGLVNGVFKSSAKLLENFHPAILKEMVCSPAGTTIRGVSELEKNAVRSAFISAIEASAKKNS